MKNLSLFVSAFALLTSSASAQTINCGTLPSCDSLGYTDTVANCPGGVIKCPFDTAKGKCIHDAAIGQIGYFPRPAGKGWLFCDGQTITKNDYPELFAFLGTTYCTTDHGGTCGTNTVRLPDYRGYFMRAVVTDPNNTKKSYSSTYANFGTTAALNWGVAAPQKQGLPNITGYFNAPELFDLTKGETGINESLNVASAGAFYYGRDYVGNKAYATPDASRDDNQYGIAFSAQKSNPIYGASSGVTPPNMAVYVYIYAGR